jgi:hypothetical protein
LNAGTAPAFWRICPAATLVLTHVLNAWTALFVLPLGETNQMYRESG